MCFLCWLWIIPPAPVLSATAAYNWHFAQLYHTRRTITPVCTSVRFTVQPTACVAEKRAERRCVGVAARVTLERRWGGLPREWAGEWEREKKAEAGTRAVAERSCAVTMTPIAGDSRPVARYWPPAWYLFEVNGGIPEVCVSLCCGCEGGCYHCLAPKPQSNDLYLRSTCVWHEWPCQRT